MTPATNPHAASASLAAFASIVWVAGGLLKGAEVDELVREHADRLRGVVLIGRDRAKIADALARHAPDVPVVDLAATDTGAMDLVVAGLQTSPTRAMSCCSRRPPHPWTCSTTTVPVVMHLRGGRAQAGSARRGVAMTSTAAKARASGSRFARVRHWFGRFESPTTTYYLLIATTAILVVFGLIMVLSASAITLLTQSKSGSAFTIFRSQLFYAGIGTGLLIASRIAVPCGRSSPFPSSGALRPAVARGLHRHHRQRQPQLAPLRAGVDPALGVGRSGWSSSGLWP